MIHAFMQRDYYTCCECMCFQPKGLEPYCERNKQIIRWDPKNYGCGDYTCTDSGKRERTYLPKLNSF